ncbi:MAG: nitroreductase family protein [Bacilli bacterium]|nr:nitroreductase family protein [Bacilli bacterium]
MDAMEMLLNRRSIRKFKKEQIKDEELKAVIKAGMYAPTAMGLQSPLIVAVQDPDDIAMINQIKMDLNKGAGFPIRPGLPYYDAPTIIVVFTTTRAKDEFLGTLDAAAVNTNMLNAAYALGLGGVWIHRADGIFATEEGKKLLKKWGITEEVKGIASMAIGYPDCENPEPRPRREGYYKIIK